MAAGLFGSTDAIRGLPRGPERNAALNDLFAEFGGLIHNVSDAVHKADDEADPGGSEPVTAEAALTLDAGTGADPTDDDDDDDAGGDDDAGVEHRKKKSTDDED